MNTSIFLVEVESRVLANLVTALQQHLQLAARKKFFVVPLNLACFIWRQSLLLLETAQHSQIYLPKYFRMSYHHINTSCTPSKR